jgi:hypothetical protein
MNDFKKFYKFSLNELRIAGDKLLLQCAHSIVIV